MDILVSAIVASVLSVIVSRYYYERSILSPRIRWAGLYPAIFIQNHGKSLSKHLRIVVAVGGETVIDNRIHPLSPEYQKGWFIPKSLGSPGDHLINTEFFSNEILVFIYHGNFPFPQKFCISNGKLKDTSLVDAAVLNNWNIQL